MAITGCGLFSDVRDPVVARVRLNILRESDVKNALGADPAPQLYEQFIEDWVNDQLWFIEAKKNVRLNRGKHKEIAEYRKLLIIKEYQDQHILANTMITENDVINYYENHKTEFFTPEEAAFIELYTCPSEKSSQTVISSLKSSENPPLSPIIKLIYKNTCVEPIDHLIFSSKNTRGILGPVFYAGEYYVISVIDKYKKGSLLPVEHVRDDIIQRLTIIKYSNALQQKQKELRDRINVKINKTLNR